MEEEEFNFKSSGDDPWRGLFDKLDGEGFGEVPIRVLHDKIIRSGFEEEVEEEWQELNSSLLLSRLQDLERSGRDQIDYQEFVSIVTRKRRLSFKAAVHSRDKQVRVQGDFKRPVKSRNRLKHLLAKGQDSLSQFFFQFQILGSAKWIINNISF